MNPNLIDTERLTFRKAKAHYKAMENVLDYLDSLGNPTALRVKKKFLKDAKDEDNILDPSEALYGFSGFLLQNLDSFNGKTLEECKVIVASMIIEFSKENDIPSPPLNWKYRVLMPEGPSARKLKSDKKSSNIFKVN